MRRRSAPLEQSGNTENERAGAHGGYIFRAVRLLADERDGISIADGADYTAHAAGNADQIEGWTVGKGVRRHQAQSTIARDGSL